MPAPAPEVPAPAPDPAPAPEPEAPAPEPETPPMGNNRPDDGDMITGGGTTEGNAGDGEIVE